MTQRKIAMVTGAGSGIGRAAALALGEAGFAVVLAGRRVEALEETRALAGPKGAEMLVVPTDVSKPDSVAALFARTGEAYGRLDFLFNNAGAGAYGQVLEDLPFDKWQEIVSVNLTGVFLCTRAAFSMMKAQTPRGGRIVNNGSIAAQAPRPNSIAYTATKHAITGLTKSASLDGRAYDIACGQIDIGNAASAILGAADNPLLQPDGSRRAEPRIGLDDVARAVLLMAQMPLDANVLFMTVTATKMPFVGRG